MPCRSDYMEPTQHEANRKQTSKLIVFVDKKLGIETPEDIVKASEHIYGEPVHLNVVVPMLCEKLSNLTLEQADDILYNGRDKTSRELADWWEEHLEADRKRLQEELDKTETKAARDSAIQKLTPHERRVLGLWL